MQLEYRVLARLLARQMAELEEEVEKLRRKWGRVAGATDDLEEAKRELQALKNRLESL
ncbi:MAG: hypothetical protein HPY90_06570 [Syntrophothermus sp.]|uniref:hypothetical protein n=1 Tax=Syntrophothermus sp. TaxID=2736299 RepID=UPI00257E923C|nr:hypothetical protein [Syntrophothermus sp.]NSW82928.1 hypothetical protein [Syntrophothermus sp.]